MADLKPGVLALLPQQDPGIRYDEKNKVSSEEKLTQLKENLIAASYSCLTKENGGASTDSFSLVASDRM